MQLHYLHPKSLTQKFWAFSQHCVISHNWSLVVRCGAEIKSSPSGGWVPTNQDNKGEFWAGDLWKSITGSRGEVMNTSSPAYIIQASLHLATNLIIVTIINMVILCISSSGSSSEERLKSHQSFSDIQLRIPHHHCHQKGRTHFFWCKIGFLLVPPFACQPFNGPPVRPGKTELFYPGTFLTQKCWQSKIEMPFFLVQKRY